MQNYSLTILIKDKLDEKARTGLIDDVKKNFGNLTREDLWGIRTLSYEIKHMDKAFYANFEFESEPPSVITLDKNIRLNEDIIRYLLIKSKKAKRVRVRKESKESSPAGTESKESEVAVKTEISAFEEKEEKPVVKKVVRKITKKA